MNDILNHLPESEQKKLIKEKQPSWIEPMLATLTDDRFSDENWIFERKFDGERCLSYMHDGKLQLLSRNQKSLNPHYPELIDAFKKQQLSSFIVDGEIVAFKGKVTSFEALQNRMFINDPKEALRSKVKIYYYLFDILYLEGYKVDEIQQRYRKSVLKRSFKFDDPIRYTPHRNKSGEVYFNEACKKGWEGIIAKNALVSYAHSRSKNWLKFKCVKQQEFIITGFTEPQGERIGFGALLLGYYDNNTLRYAGKVGTGFDDESLKQLTEKLKAVETSNNPYPSQEIDENEIHWTKPDLVAEIGFEEWTKHDKLRQPRYLGLRQDKNPKDVIREEP